MTEIELKLQLDVASAEGLGASNMLPEQWRTVQQRDLYFDTADRALAEAGLSLRIRQSGSHRTQTIKKSGSSAAGHLIDASSDCGDGYPGDPPKAASTLKAGIGARAATSVLGAALIRSLMGDSTCWQTRPEHPDETLCDT